MKRKTMVYGLVAILGILLGAVGLLSNHIGTLPVSKILAPLGGIALGLGVGGLLGQSMIESDPVLQQREKEKNDERNTAIRYRAEALAGNITTALLALGGAVSCALDAPWWVTAALLGTAFFNVLMAAVFTLWFQRKM